MFVIGATVVATRSGRSPTDGPTPQLAAPSTRRSASPPHPTVDEQHDDSDDRADRSILRTHAVSLSARLAGQPMPLAFGTVGRHEGRCHPPHRSPRRRRRSARDREAAGYSGIWTAETSHDPFLPLVLAAEHTETVEIGTSIAVAFARNPMLLANIGWDLQAYSQGRFILGLGSQIKPHITKRFSMEWSHPAPRMREMILAIRAIWDTWLNGTPLQFRGEFYTHTLMTPFFTPRPPTSPSSGRRRSSSPASAS